MESSQKSDSMVIYSCSEGLFVTKGPMSPTIPASSEFPRPEDQYFRKKEPYQHRPDRPCFLPLRRIQGGNQKMVKGGVRAPQSEVTQEFGY